MRVFLDTIGCRLNQAEIEKMARQLRSAGHEIVGAPQGADLAIVNTCTVTTQAASDSRAHIRRIAREGEANVVATGCWATVHPRPAAALPGVAHVIPNERKDDLVGDVLRLPRQAIDLEPVERRPLPGVRRRTRAFIKVQDGCNNRCTFCVTTIARGPARSRPIAGVVADVRAAISGGSREIVLTGVQLGSWGQELGLRLKDLVAALLRETDVPRIRLSSLEPWDLDSGFFSLWEDARLCKHVHLPLQSGHRATLRRMARKTTPETFRELVNTARTAVPDLAVTTDVIAGFPGEGEADFRESLQFVRELGLAGGHAFTYSPMAGTAAARMGRQVPPTVRKERTKEYIRAFDEAARAFQAGQIGTTRPVLWESADPAESGAWMHSGLTDNYLRVHGVAPEPRWNKIDEVRLTEGQDSGLRGRITKTG